MKVALVTGGNSGIGKHTVIGLLREGYWVSFTSRDPKRGEAALAEIKEASGSDQVECLRLDLSSFASIHQCAEEMQARHERLDLLVNNAGLVLSDRRETAEGFEMTLGVNHIGHFLLTTLLLGRLRSSAPARIVNLASDAHKGARQGLDFDDLQCANGYSGMQAYCRSKLANIYFTQELARRLETDDITSYAVHPGVVATGFARDGDTSGFISAVIGLARPFLTSESKGARTSLHVCLRPRSELNNGGYYASCKPAKLARPARDEQAAQRLWEVTEKLVADAEADRDTRVDEP